MALSKKAQQLWQAIDAGDVQSVYKLTKPSMFDKLPWSDSDIVNTVDASEKGHRTPLFAATCAGNEQMCSVLLEHGADPDSAIGSMPDEWRLLSALDVAVMDGKDGIAGKLIKFGASVDEPFFGIEGARNLLSVAADNNDTKMCRLLLEAGADPNSPDHDGKTPLHYAAHNSAQNMLEMLIDAGAYANAQDMDGNTPLHVVAPKGRISGYSTDPELGTGYALMQRGANPNIANNEGKTARDVASDDFISQVLEYEDQREHIELKELDNHELAHSQSDSQTIADHMTRQMEDKAARVIDDWTPSHADSQSTIARIEASMTLDGDTIFRPRARSRWL